MASNHGFDDEGGFVPHQGKNGRNGHRNTNERRIHVRVEIPSDVRRRWVNDPPLTVAREMISEAEHLDLSTQAELIAEVSGMGDKLAEFISSGKLAQRIAAV